MVVSGFDSSQLFVFVCLCICFVSLEGRGRRKGDDEVMFCLPLCTPFHSESIYLSHTHNPKARESCEAFNNQLAQL